MKRLIPIFLLLFTIQVNGQTISVSNYAKFFDMEKDWFRQNNYFQWNDGSCCNPPNDSLMDVTRAYSGIRSQRYLCQWDFIPCPAGGKTRTDQKFPDNLSYQWVDFKIYLDSSYTINDPIAELFFQLHHRSDSVGPVPFGIWINNGRYQVQIFYYPNGYTQPPVSVSADLGPVAPDANKWVHWTFHNVMSVTNTGLWQIWKNGKKIYERAGPNYNLTETSWYYKIGIYKWNWKTTSTPVVKRRVWWLDDLKVGTAANTIADFRNDPVFNRTVVTNPVCYGQNGTATVIDSMGIPNYTYLWTGPNGFTSTSKTISAPAGTYTVVTTDAVGQKDTATAIITQPTKMGVSSVTGAFNGTTAPVTISATGGTPSYQGVGTFNQPNGTFTYPVKDANGCRDSAVVTISFTFPPLSATLSSSNVSCFGGADGSIIPNVSGGQAPYTYAWTNALGTLISINPTVSLLPAGAYSVVITDNQGNQVTKSTTITQPAKLTVSHTNGTITTLGGTTTVSITAAGGTPGYNGVGNFIQGVGTTPYTVSDVKGCIARDTVTILYTPSPISIALTATNIDCFGNSNGAISSSITGGTPPYRYTWKNSAGTVISTATSLSSLPADSYSLSIIDSLSSTATKAITVAQPSKVTVSHTNGVITTNGGTTSVLISATGGTPPYINAGSFTQGIGTVPYAVTDANGCIGRDTVTLVYTATPLLLTVSTTNVSCNGDSTGSAVATVTGGITPYTYVYKNASGTTLSISNTLTGAPAGSYTLTVTDAISTVGAKSLTITQPTALSVTAKQDTDATVTITATGGASPYFGTGSFTNQTEGAQTYRVTDSKGCFVDVTIIVRKRISQKVVSTSIKYLKG